MHSKPSSVVATLLTCALTANLSGCSYMLVESPPRESQWEEVSYANCSTGKGPPVVDTVFSVSTGISSLVVTVYSLPFFALWLSSAIYGYSETKKCAQLEEYLAVKKDAKSESASESKHSREVDVKPAPKPDSDVFKKAKRCQEKGGVWIDGSCRVEIEDDPVAAKPTESTTSAAPSSPAKGEPALRDMDFDKLKARAEGGDADAQYQLGYRYSMGDGVEPNRDQMFFWYQRAALSGHKKAAIRLREEKQDPADIRRRPEPASDQE